MSEWYFKMPFLEIILRNIRISDIFLHNNDHYVQKCLLLTLQKKIGSTLNARFNVMVIISYSFRHVMEHQGAVVYVFVKTLMMWEN